jgi:diguanylate cyclase (GGDEF)-like protein/PAS domain S-box-containing protein
VSDDTVTFRRRKKGGGPVQNVLLLAAVLVVAGLTFANLRQARERTRAEHRFQALVENAHDKFSIIDADGTFIYVSPAAEKLYGMAPQELLGPFQLDPLVHPDDRAVVNDAFAHSLRSPGELVRFDLRIKRPNGEYLHLDNTYLNLLHDPAVRGVISTEHDATERVKNEETMRRDAAFSSLALSIAAEMAASTTGERLAHLHDVQQRGCAFFDADFAASFNIDADGNTRAVISLRGGDSRNLPVEFARRFSLVLPNVIEFMRSGEMVILHSLDDLPGDWDEEREFYERWGVRSLILSPLAERNELFGYLALGTLAQHRRWDPVTINEVRMLSNISTQRWLRDRSERGRHEADRRARLLARYVSDEIFVIDRRGRISWTSRPSSASSWAFDESVLLGRSAVEFVHPDDADEIAKLAVAGCAEGATGTTVARLMASDESWHWGEVTLAPADPDASEVHELAVVVRDIHEQRIEAERLAEQAMRDPLTGLSNRTLLLTQLRIASRTARQPFAVAFCDLDGFKEINDAYGHRVGDEVLVVVADRLQAATRPTDLVARFGGDEFVVLLRDVDNEEAIRACHRMLEAVCDPMVVDAGPIAVTGSIGVVLAVGGEDALSLVTAADRLMYQAKNSGKNRVQVGTSS